MSIGAIIGAVLASALAGWFGHALHLKAKTAQQADQAIGGQPGSAQKILDAAGNAVVSAAEQAAETALERDGKPGA